MDTVQEMLDYKGHDVWSVTEKLTVFELIEKMAEKEVGALPVLTDDGQLAGIVSERDFARKVMLLDKSAHDTVVADIMTKNVITVDACSSIEKCMTLMSENKIRHLPVLDGNQLTGIITVGDLLKATITEQSETISELESFIYEETGGEG